VRVRHCCIKSDLGSHYVKRASHQNEVALVPWHCIKSHSGPPEAALARARAATEEVLLQQESESQIQNWQ
jgi:hypothetical protein